MFYIGQGVDTHELANCKAAKILLGGYPILSNWRIISYSDGDIVLHALSNAILGALQLGDIGDYFSDTDVKNKKMNSQKILAFCLQQLKKRKCEIVNIDLTITCENIMLYKNKQNINNSLIKLTGCNLVNTKATRFEIPTSLIKCDIVILVKQKEK